MDVLTNTRGRGFRTSGAPQRGISKNKQWIAPGQERSGGSDSERWERGGGPRRGGGRGRGRGRGALLSSGPSSTPHLTVPTSHYEGTSGTEDEAMSDAEDEEHDEEQKEPETQEERDKLYQELVKAREVERKKAIAEGKMDDPLVPKRLEDAITMVGTCMDMCPRFERYQRERQHQLDKWECIPGTRRVDHKRAVKRYERAAGDKVLPSDLRPPPVLKKTLDYLFHDLIPRGGFKETSFFIRDRTRQIRNDLTIQHETGPLAIECHERCARFHALSMHLMRGYADFDIKMEERILMNTLQSLKEFWDDRRGDFPFPYELEMRLYHRLVHIRDTSSRPEAIPEHITSHPVFQLVTRFRAHVQVISAPIRRDSKLVVDEEGMSIFRELAASLMSHTSRVVMYLVACVMEGVFGEGTIEDIDAIRGDLTVQEIIDGVEKPFGEPVSAGADGHDEEQNEDPNTGVMDEFNIDEQSNAAPPAIATGSWFPPNQQISALATIPKPQPSSALPITNTQPTPPVKSAFGNLVSTPSAFGITFPITAPSVSTGTAGPQSAFPVSSSSTTPALPHPPVPPAQPNIPNPILDSRPQTHETPKSGSADSFSHPSPAPAPHHTNSSLIHAITPVQPTVLNPTAIVFTPQSTLLRGSSGASSSNSTSIFSTTATFIPQPAQPANTHPAVSTPTPLAAVPTLPVSAFTTPPLVSNAISSASSATNGRVEPHIVDRRQTLWDLPSTTPASIADIKHLVPPANVSSSQNGAQLSPSKLDSGGIPISPMEPPPLNKPAPMSLPPTPTARWFDPSSLTGAAKPQDSSLALRKQSLGLLGLQMPNAPSPAEILSPLTIGTPKTGIPHITEEYSPTPAGPVASTSRMLLSDSEPPSPTIALKGKGRATRAEMKESALAFARHGSTVRKCFRLWMKKTMDRAEWAEACVRSDVYKETVQRHRLSSSTDVPARSKNAAVLRRPSFSETGKHVQKRRKARGSGQYTAPVTDEELVKRLKENHEEQQRRWAQGSFLTTVISTVNALTTAAALQHPSEWHVWLSSNSENDGTAIWLEHKFDVPASGGWISESIFSIPIERDSREHRPTIVGSPGLIVFERTPTGDLEDPIEKKYRVLDDCARLREIATRLGSEPKLRYTPALLVLTWADIDGPDASPDFDDMIRELINARVIGGVQNVVLSSKNTDWDKRFYEALVHTNLDFIDKTMLTLTWQAVCNIYLAPFRAHASDWLDSCWTDDQLDWSRYGDVMRSIEQLQVSLRREVLGLIHQDSDSQIRFFTNVQTPGHLDAAYATGPFLDACLKESISQIEQVLGTVASSYVISRDMIDASRRRFEQELQVTSENLRQLAALTLSSRSVLKRRAEDPSDIGSPTSGTKRLRLSPSPTMSAYGSDLEGDMDQAVHGFLTPPPLSTAPSTTALSEPASKPQVTVAMLRALAQGVLKSAR